MFGIDSETVSTGGIIDVEYIDVNLLEEVTIQDDCFWIFIVKKGVVVRRMSFWFCLKEWFKRKMEQVINRKV